MASNSGSSDLEHSLALLWGEAAPGQRGPRPRLSVEKIAQAGIEVADAEGLNTVSMQRVAAWLGYTTMSIYNHIPSKNLLLEVMADTAAGDPPELDGIDDWREAVLHWVDRLWAAFQAHPWILRIPIDHAPMGPKQLTWLDRVLRPLLASGLPAEKAMAAALHLIATIRGMAQVHTDVARRHLTPEEAERANADVDRLMARFIDPGRFPALAEVYAAEHDTRAAAQPSGAEDGPADAAGILPGDLRFTLERFLDGLGAWTPPPAS